MSDKREGREITGRQVFFVTAAAFGIIIGANLVLAVQAVRTFPGLEVKNSYVASQSFDARRKAQEALGWSVATEITPQGQLRIAFSDRDGRMVQPVSVEALVGRSTSATEDQRPTLVFDGGAYTAPVSAGRGVWVVRVTAVAEDGTTFEKRLTIRVPS